MASYRVIERKETFIAMGDKIAQSTAYYVQATSAYDPPVWLDVNKGGMTKEKALDFAAKLRTDYEKVIE